MSGYAGFIRSKGVEHEGRATWSSKDQRGWNTSVELNEVKMIQGRRGMSVELIGVRKV